MTNKMMNKTTKIVLALCLLASFASADTIGTLSPFYISSTLILPRVRNLNLILDRGITLGNSTSTATGTIRWSGTAFEGYNGVSWASLGSGGGGGINSLNGLTDSTQTFTTSSTATGLLLNILSSSGNHAFSVSTTNGYVLVLSASTTQWNNLVASSSNWSTYSYNSSTFPTYAYNSSTFITFSYASSVFPTYAYNSSTFPTFAYASSAYATSGQLTGYVPYSYASSVFATYSYGSTTFATFAYNSSTFPTFSYVSSSFATSGQIHNALTIGTPANGLSVNGSQVLTIGLASTNATGALSATDWNTFNGKQNALTTGNLTNGTNITIGGSGTGAVIGTGASVALNDTISLTGVSSTYATGTYARFTNATTTNFYPTNIIGFFGTACPAGQYAYAIGTDGTLSCRVDQSGGGGVGGGWSTTSANTILYPTNSAHIVVIGSNATSAMNTIFETNGNAYIKGFLKADSVTTTNASTTNLTIGTNFVWGTNNGLLEAVNGVVRATTTANFLTTGTASATYVPFSYASTVYVLRGTMTDTKFCTWDNANSRINCTSDAGVGGAFTTTSINGLATTTFSFSSSSDTNITISITTSTNGINFVPGFTGTLADARITSATKWNALDTASTSWATYSYLTSTRPTFAYASSVFSTYAYNSSTFPTFSYASSTFVSFSYGSSTYATTNHTHSTYVPYTGATASLNLGAYGVSSTYATATWATIANISSTNLTVSGNSYVGTVKSGTWNGSIIGTTYLGTGTQDATTYLRGDGTWQPTSSLGIHSPITLTGENYLSLTGQVLTANKINISNTNITASNGLTISTNDIQPATNYSMFLTASGTAWNNATYIVSNSSTKWDSAYTQAHSAVTENITGIDLTGQALSMTTGYFIPTTSPAFASVTTTNLYPTNIIGATNVSTTNLTIATNFNWGSNNGLLEAVNGAVRATTTANFLTTGTASATYVPFSYASTVFPTYAYASSTFVPFSYASSTFVTFSYGSSTYATTAHTHSTSSITSGVFGPAFLGTGTANASSYLAGDGTWKATSTLNIFSSPLTTKGDLLAFSNVNTRLGVGGDGQKLTASSTASTGLAWASSTVIIPVSPSGFFNTDSDIFGYTPYAYSVQSIACKLRSAITSTLPTVTMAITNSAGSAVGTVLCNTSTAQYITTTITTANISANDNLVWTASNASGTFAGVLISVVGTK